MSNYQTSAAELDHFMSTVPPPPSYEHAQSAAQHTRGNAHIIAASTRRANPTEAAAAAEAPDLSPLPQSLNRPRLPEAKRNRILDSLPEEAAIVKFQTIVRENKEITVGRIKLPVPSPGAHAFILRRYDTDAISLTTMYKVAFPGADEEDEAREMEWVKSSFDTRNTNGERDNEHVRLAGQWVSRHLAVHLAPAYNMKALITTLARAVPDPTIAYRKSQRSQAAAADLQRQQTPSAPGAGVPSMLNPAAFGAADDADGPRVKRTRASAADDAEGEEETQTFRLEAQTSVTGPATDARAHMEAEIAQAKQMVIDLRRELSLQAANGRSLEDTGVALPENTRGVRRSRDSAAGTSAVTAAVAGSSAATVGANIAPGQVDADGARVIRTNRTIERGPLATGARRFAFNTFIFGLGVGAAAFLPQLASQYL